MGNPKNTVIISHWNTMIQGLQQSPLSFFEAVEEAVKSKNIEGTKYSRIDWREGGVFSAKREYLRIRRQNYTYDICGAPFGNGFFVSWWLGEVPSGCMALLLSIPGLGFWMEKMFRPLTYYKIDTATMFQSLVHSAVLEVVDDMIKTNGLKALAPAERSPKMRDFFNL